MSTPFEVAADLVELAVVSEGRVHGVVVRFGAQLQTKVRANMSGRPGPRAITGNLRRSVNRQTTRGAHSSTSRVGSSAPQARRLELGFSGTDSLGRNYDQSPFPAFGPAADEIADPFAAAVRVAAIPGGLR